MRLAHKLSISQLALIGTILVAYATIQFFREVRIFENDMIRDHHSTGVALRSAVEDVWTERGRAKALAIVADANAVEPGVRVDWVPLGASGTSNPGPNPGGSNPVAVADKPARDGSTASFPDWMRPLSEGHEVVRIERSGGGLGDRTTYVPVPVQGKVLGALRLSESLREERRFVRSTLLHLFGTTAAIAFGAVLISILVGSSLIVEPMHALVLQARRIGSGDLTQRIESTSRDEISELVAEMNKMCSQIEESRARLKSETRARIATLEQLRHADRLATVGTLASGIAHELGTPLNVVSGRARMVETEAGNRTDIANNVRIIREQAERMTRIIRQLLDFSRLKSPQKAIADSTGILKETLSLLKPFAEKRSVAFDFAQEDPAAGTLAVDAEQMKQVFTNIVMNGIQAMPDGGTLKISLREEMAAVPDARSARMRKCLCLAFRDQGCGIPPESLPRVFDPFFTTKGIGEGTGLGLSVSYGIVREHRGWIGVESEVGKGSCFTIYLPLEEVPCGEES
jgi:two-component system, NtrC family, sensor kinase